MSLSLDFTTLRRAYRGGTQTPLTVAAEVLARIAAAGDDHVWITRVAPEALLADARALAERSDPEALPLFGLPFAIKDNIDVAGLPTGCGCPALDRAAAASAPVVERLRRAGALFVGKTNLDQFATGLVGTRSPYGVPRNPFDAAYIPGGSSSGSAVAVAAGLVSFALGTDTAGSGRVPAAFGNIVGLKPTHGLVSTRGVVPACRSLDCVSIFALTVEDAAAVLDIVRDGDEADPSWRRPPPGFAAMGRVPPRFAFGVLPTAERSHFASPEIAALYDAAIARLAALGGTPVEIDYAPFLEANRLLYHGAWLAERAAAIDAATGGRRAVLHPVLAGILDGARAITAADAFADRQRLAGLRRATEAVWRQVDLLALPTASTTYRIAEIAAEPVALNETLGRYTNFCNLLDLAALAVPAGLRRDGLPFGVTLLGPAFHDPLLAAVGAALHAAAGLPLGATGVRHPGPGEPTPGATFPYLPIAVVGAHLSGEPLNRELVALGARLRRAGRTAPCYRLYALPDGRRPGLVRRAADGAAIEVEVWDVPSAAVGALLAGIAPPLGLGTVRLDDGSEVCGFLCEAHAVEGARDISAYGGWRAWRRAAGT
ncbi:MAG TPA: allophanate hydrolase [Stellaceae bacterium]|nr:allophanate hydrolase [Stellaceae bacterium]